MEALLLLTVAQQALRIVPFQKLTPWFSRPLETTELAENQRRAVCEQVRWAINRMARHLSAGTICFPRAIAAQIMLRRRRLGTEMYYGAAVLPEKGLTAHVWLQDGDTGIVGWRTASQYVVLACYSTSHSTSMSDPRSEQTLPIVP